MIQDKFITISSLEIKRIKPLWGSQIPSNIALIEVSRLDRCSAIEPCIGDRLPRRKKIGGGGLKGRAFDPKFFSSDA